ncbi:MAG TPA: hypothetical protein VHX38_00200 [Pseudonocardiaceae bacterium]|jgi:hypothetical protein|nr:hypothetical protein [Pseudonocardiaceae bacterium]
MSIAPARLDHAARFLAATARVLEYRRFQHLFLSPDPDGVLAALSAYATQDGGYGYALEPDGRGPASQPLHVDLALRVLVEVDRLTEQTGARIADYLASISHADGGVPAVHPSIADHPRAPWWVVDDAARGSLIPTASLVGLLRAGGVEHPWLNAATEFCWTRIEKLTDTHPYEIINCLIFLDNADDRARAAAQAKRLGELVRARRFVLLDPSRPQDAQLAPGYAPGEFMFPHDYAPRPDSLASKWFSAEERRLGLAHLAQSQAEDGGWSARSLMWTPAVVSEWRGLATLQALTTLEAFADH